MSTKLNDENNLPKTVWIYPHSDHTLNKGTGQVEYVLAQSARIVELEAQNKALIAERVDIIATKREQLGRLEAELIAKTAAFDRISKTPDTTMERMDEMESNDPDPDAGCIEVGKSKEITMTSETHDVETVDNVAMEIAFSGRHQHDVSRNAREFWDHTGSYGQSAARVMARAALSAMPPQEVSVQSERDACAALLEKNAVSLDALWAELSMMRELVG